MYHTKGSQPLAHSSPTLTHQHRCDALSSRRSPSACSTGAAGGFSPAPAREVEAAAAPHLLHSGMRSLSSGVWPGLSGGKQVRSQRGRQARRQSWVPEPAPQGSPRMGHTDPRRGDGDWGPPPDRAAAGGGPRSPPAAEGQRAGASAARTAAASAGTEDL